ncbi:MAG: hypothetical protein ACLRIS_02005 [Flavonifractor plautii]
MVDFTANADPEKCALPVLRTMEEAPLERITISSDAGGACRDGRRITVPC